MENSLDNIPSGPLLSIRDFSKKHGWPQGGLRHLCFYRPKGFEQVLRRIGRKVLIHEQQFFDWVDRINSPKADAGNATQMPNPKNKTRR